MQCKTTHWDDEETVRLIFAFRHFVNAAHASFELLHIILVFLWFLYDVDNESDVGKRVRAKSLRRN